MRREARVDRIRIKFDKSTVTRDAAGYARVWGRAVGGNEFLTYSRADGRKSDNHIEFVSEATVNDAEAIFSLKMKPVTFHHPPVMLTSKNTSRYQIGSAIDAEFRDADKGLWVHHLITDSDTLDKVDDGVVELSLAYTAVIDETGGVFDGRHFDSAQSARRYNHIAILPQGRAGPENSLQLDAISPSIFDADGLAIQVIEDQMKTIKIDGKDVEVTDEVAAAFNAKDQEFELFKKKKKGEEDAEDDPDDPKKKRDAAPAADPEPAKVEDAKPIDLAKFRKEIVADFIDGMKTAQDARTVSDGARTTLETEAKPMLPKSFSMDGKTNDEVMRAAIVAVNPDLKTVIDQANGEYLSGMFSIAKASKPTDRHALGDSKVSKPEDEGKDIFQLRADAAKKLWGDKIGGTEAMKHKDMRAVGSK